MGNKKLTFLFLNQNIFYVFSKEASKWDSSFEQPEQPLYKAYIW